MAGSRPTLRVARKNITEMPTEYRVQYPDLNANYAVGAQSETFIGASHTNIIEVTSSVVMTADEGKRFAQKQMYSAHSARYQVQWSTSHAYAWLEPTDIVTLPRGNVTYTVRIVDKKYSGNRIEWAGETEDPSVYSQAGMGGVVAVSLAGVSVDAVTLLQVMDIPLLRTADDGTGLYVAAAGVVEGWQGAELYASTDGTTYTDSGVALLPGAAIGYATSVLADFTGGNVFDTLSRVTVVLGVTSTTLASASRLEVLNGANHALLGDEIIAFATATLVDTRTYVLTNLLRGRVGTEQHTDAHVIGERFVLLNAAGVRRVAAPVNQIGGTIYHKAVTFRRTVAQTAPVASEFADMSQKCLSPVSLRGARDASTGDITISWTRRSRFPSDWVDYSDITLGEASERYDLEIWNSTYTTLLRTFSGLTSASQLYTNAQQSNDYGSPPPSTIYCKVYQTNAIVGRGFALQGSVT